MTTQQWPRSPPHTAPDMSHEDRRPPPRSEGECVVVLIFPHNIAMAGADVRAGPGLESCGGELGWPGLGSVSMISPVVVAPSASLRCLNVAARLSDSDQGSALLNNNIKYTRRIAHISHTAVKYIIIHRADTNLQGICVLNCLEYFALCLIFCVQ